jgi:YD repeat-containing protein
MNSRRAVTERVRWIVVFTVLLLSSFAVPVFVADAVGEDTPEEAAVESSPAEPPDEYQVREGIEAAERENAARERELQAPELVLQREESRTAFASLSGSAAQELLLKVFSNQIASLNADPARYLSDVELVRSYDESAATVSDEGDGSLLEAGIPVRTEDSEGDLSKVDLSLEETGTGFEPANPLIDLQIPDSADESIEIGDEGLAMSPTGIEEAEAQILDEKNVWFPDVQVDTDMLVSPISSGVEVFNQLRSADSPETLHFQLDLPEGAEIQKNGAGGADISQVGQVVAMVEPPSAVDAQGTPVPVELEVQDETVALHVPHRERDFAYPILVDPAITENWGTAWYYGTNNEAIDKPGIWGYATSDPTETYILHNTYCLNAALCSPSGRGLFISTLNRNIPPNTWAQWYYNVPGSTTYIPSIYPEYSAHLNPFWRNNGNCSWNSYQQPHDYDGAYDASGNWVYLETDRAQWVGTATIFTKAKGIAFGMSTAGSWVNIPCWRNIMLGGTVIRLDDPEAPALSSLSGVPTTWVSDTTQFTITANASDPGLGVQNVTMAPEGTAIRYFTALQNQCPGIKTKPCPASTGSQLVANGTLFDEGEKGVKFSVYDPTGKTSNTISKTIRVDRTPPEVTLAGQLAIATNEDKGDTQDPEKWDPLPLPVYNLKIEAKDGSTATPAAKRSGVKSIAVYLDGKTTAEQSWEQTCAASSCPMTKSYPLKVSGLVMGKHTLEVKVKDQVGKERVRNIEFEYFPATGMKDDYVMHYFPLEEGQAGGAEEDHSGPELAVNVMNGNLVYREQDIDVEGSSSIDLEVERYYNSQLPDAANTEWGDGWTLAEAPQLNPEDTGGAPAPDQAQLVDSTGTIEDDVTLPAATNGEKFDGQLQGTLTKTTSGYELRDETGEQATSVVFNESGQTEELQASEYTGVDFDYKGGDLSEIAVDDPGSTGGAVEVEYPNPPAYNPRYSSAFGSYGSGSGQLSAPGDVARDSSGNLWVVNTANNRIEKFNAKGEFIAKYGSYGSGDGQFKHPTAIALTKPSGYVLVADSGNNRIQKLTPAGAYHSKFGTKGTGNGQFGGAGPEGIAFGPESNIWVSDTYNGRLQRFTAEGAFIESLSSKGSAPGQLGEPTGIDFGPEGRIWVADWQNNRVSVFRTSLDENQERFVRQFGTAGSDEGEFDRPDTVEVDDKGNVWVGDQNNGRIQRFNIEGEYRTEFGTKGTGQAQFSFARPMGITSSPTGELWITDVANNRIQKWQIPAEVPAYSSSFGSGGTGDGQMQSPGDVAIDAQGNFWVLDTANNRIEKFNAKGEFIAKYGSYGSGDGQFIHPTAIALTKPSGYVLVADSGNNRIQKLTPAGAYHSKFGTKGTGNGQFGGAGPEGIAFGPESNIWVSDTYNGRLQRFTAEGAFLAVVGSKGSGSGQLGEPTGIDFGPEGYVWVSDSQNNRVSVFSRNPEGGEIQFLRQFGTVGSGDGQFNRPDAIDVDAEGNVWVGDQNNGRVQRFNQNGEYLAQFGTKGSGEGQFNFINPFGIATDDQGGIWVTDPNNNRIQEWLISSRIRIEDDPSVEVSTSAGLIDSVEGEEAGEHSYDHEGDKLVSHDGPQGETQYSYDSAGRLAGIVLPDGTSALINYNGGYGRVSSVTVDLAGATPAKTTEFNFSDEPRRTVVIPPDAPHVTYDIGEDGSVLKWWNAEQPPVFDDISGSLYFDREKGPISVGDHNLAAQAHSEEGIASIHVIANGNVVVDEMKCEKPQVIECTTLVNEWVTETGAHAPGILYLEVLATDRLGHTASERLWVDIPYTPPESPGAIPAPKFKDIKRFREEYGLEVVFPVANELELNDRIFDLIGAWHNPQTPAGEVARASWERWGVPMRAADVAEMEYREWFNDVNGERIDKWVEEFAPGNFAGYYMDHKAGGIMHVGFTENQAVELENLKATLPLVAQERLQVYPATPTTPYLSLEATSDSIVSAVESNATLRNLVTSLTIGESDNQIHVGALDVAQVKSILNGAFGNTSSIVVEYLPRGEHLTGRFRNSGRMRAGDSILNANIERCTAGFGAYDKFKVAGKDVLANFVLTAGHCYGLEELVLRSPHADPSGSEDWRRVGFVKRRAYGRPESMNTDTEAIRIDEDGIVPRGIFGWGGNLIPTEAATKARVGNLVCFSGAHAQVPSCGEVVAREKDFEDEGVRSGGYLVEFETRADHGDSGAPVWNRRTGASIGLVTGGNEYTGLTLVEPLLHPPRMNDDLIPGILHNKWLQPLQLKLGG